MNLEVNEIFYSLQGEGGRMGEASIFIRLTGCNLQCDFCDTDFNSGIELDLETIKKKISAFSSKWIVWTGGEPLLQLTDDILSFFKDAGYRQAVESNGLLPLSDLFDYKVCSPKGNKLYAKKTNPVVDEIRVPVKYGDSILPVEEFPVASFYFLSPVFEEHNHLTMNNIQYCVDYIKRHPEWRLSLQIHKLINIP